MLHIFLPATCSDDALQARHEAQALRREVVAREHLVSATWLKTGRYWKLGPRLSRDTPLLDPFCMLQDLHWPGLRVADKMLKKCMFQCLPFGIEMSRVFKETI